MRLYSKGADSVMFDLLASGEDRNLASLSSHLHAWGEEALRTLVFAKREVDQFDEWNERWERANASPEEVRALALSNTPLLHPSPPAPAPSSRRYRCRCFHSPPAVVVDGLTPLLQSVFTVSLPFYSRCSLLLCPPAVVIDCITRQPPFLFLQRVLAFCRRVLAV